MDEFAKWLYLRPDIAPGHRKSYETYHAIRANKTDKLAASDIPDNAHIYALPYVDVATMDRRMTGYITQVQRQLNKSYPGTPITPVYPNVKVLIDNLTP